MILTRHHFPCPAAVASHWITINNNDQAGHAHNMDHAGTEGLLVYMLDSNKRGFQLCYSEVEVLKEFMSYCK